MSEIPDSNTQEMSTFAYALLENYEVFGKTEDEYEIGTRDKLIQYIGGLESKVAELESAQRWIPVSERLPEEDTDGNTLMAICRHSGEWVRAPFGAEFADEFVRHYTHWMYAPQPPEVQE